VYSADEAFTTGTFAGLAPVRSIDGRMIGEGNPALPGPMVARLQALYRDLIARDIAMRAGVRLA
jgi:branched-chain amino acid aminotransferase